MTYWVRVTRHEAMSLTFGPLFFRRLCLTSNLQYVTFEYGSSRHRIFSVSIGGIIALCYIHKSLKSSVPLISF